MTPTEVEPAGPIAQGIQVAVTSMV